MMQCGCLHLRPAELSENTPFIFLTVFPYNSCNAETATRV